MPVKAQKEADDGDRRSDWVKMHSESVRRSGSGWRLVAGADRVSASHKMCLRPFDYAQLVTLAQGGTLA